MKCITLQCLRRLSLLFLISGLLCLSSACSESAEAPTKAPAKTATVQAQSKQSAQTEPTLSSSAVEKVAQGVALMKKKQPADYPKAYQLFSEAAKAGEAAAEYNLGLMHMKGYGAPQSFSEAAKWYEKAAQREYEDAQYNLGILHMKGQGFPLISLRFDLYY